MNIPLFIYSFAYAFCNVVGAALIKSEINSKLSLNSISDYFNLLFNLKVIVGFVVVFGSALILFKGLSLFDFSKIIPLSIGINFILTSILGVVIFKEIITIYGVVGMGIILLGIIILNFN